MKTLSGVLLVAACLLASTHGFPGARDSDSDEEKNSDTILLLPNGSSVRFMRPYGGAGFPDMSFEDSDSVENPTWTWNGMFRSNFLDGWYSRIQAHMKRLRDQIAGILSRIPEEGVVPSVKIPEGANTTSTTKIIDGHVVTINETTYMDGDDEFGTLIRIRVIDVKPQNETILLTESAADAEVTTLPTITTSKTATSRDENTTTPPRSVETVEDSDNEIPKNQVDTLSA
ncbi:icarapin-like [Osmia lignaria lignaria]|uniref:icarapin-like n=1 Tax=Osmia lignaria lignaria TaxID=1437193 RepID=UPI00147892A3|nr:icarapin-like [Osmia lignaria]